MFWGSPLTCGNPGSIEERQVTDMKRWLIAIFTALCAWNAMAFITPTPAYALGYRVSSYWCGNSNYRMAYMHMGSSFYVDLHSAYIANQWTDDTGDNTVYVTNIVIVNENGRNRTYATRVLVEISEDGPAFYEQRDGQWTSMTGYGYQQPNFNTAWILLHYFSGEAL